MKKSEKAMKLMQALSGVDEELLSRTEERKTEHKIVRFMNRYGKGCAACFCLIVAGTVFFAMHGLKTGNTTESIMDMAPELQTNMTAGGARDGAADEAAPAEIEGDEPAKEELAGVVSSYADVGETPVWLDVEMLARQAGRSAEQVEAEKYSGAQNNGVQESGETGGTISVENAMDAIQQSSTEDLRQSREAGAQPPEAYSYIGETLSEDGESRTLEWSDGEHGLWLRFTQTELTTDMRFDAEPPVYTVEEDWRELITKRQAGERQQLALLYEDGLLVEYSGCLTEEELITLLESLL